MAGERPSYSSIAAILAATSIPPSISQESEPQSSHLKRRASSALSDDQSLGRKRLKEETSQTIDNNRSTNTEINTFDASKLVDDLAEELQCGCCSELLYKPVVVLPCQHYFCGSCIVLWIKNGGTNCPACRSLTTIVTPSRPLQIMVETLLRHAPQRTRAEGEREQADQVYRSGSSMRIPAPREASPEPNLNISREYARPCPHCAPNNIYGWRCPQPIVDPNLDMEHAWHVDDGLPPGHGHCGNCENMLALNAPMTTKCDFCQVAFCGVAIQGRCCALPINAQQPQGMSEVADLILSTEVYDALDGNHIEADYLFDHLTTQRITPKHIFSQIASHYASQPQGFKLLFDLDVFRELHPVEGGIDPDPTAPRRRICRVCAAELLLFGLRDWWIRERLKGVVDQSVMERLDCLDGRACSKQKDIAHAKQYNHIIPVRSAVTASEFGNDLQERLQTETIGPAMSGSSNIPIQNDLSEPRPVFVIDSHPAPIPSNLEASEQNMSIMEDT